MLYTSMFALLQSFALSPNIHVPFNSPFVHDSINALDPGQILKSWEKFKIQE